MSNSDISIQYDEMQQLASKFEQQAQFVKQVLDQLKNHMSGLSGGEWIADAADSFYTTMNDDVFPGMQRLHIAMHSANETCVKISKAMEAAEDEACSCIPS